MMATRDETDTPDNRKLLTFEEFRELVARKEWRVRAALLALSIKSIQEGRRTRYDPAWADEVRQWIDAREAE